MATDSQRVDSEQFFRDVNGADAVAQWFSLARKRPQWRPHPPCSAGGGVILCTGSIFTIWHSALKRPAGPPGPWG